MSSSRAANLPDRQHAKLRARVTKVLIALAASLAALPAAAQPRPPAARGDVALDQFKEAVALFERNEIAAACRKFEQLYAEGAAPGTLYNMAVCHEREGKLVEAYSEYDDLASRAEAAVRTDKAAAIRARANAILPRLARVDLIHRADAVSGVIGLSLDGRALLPTRGGSRSSSRRGGTSSTSPTPTERWSRGAPRRSPPAARRGWRWRTLRPYGSRRASLRRAPSSSGRRPA